MVDVVASVMHLQCDSAIAIPALIFMVDRHDFFLLNAILVWLLHSLEIVVIRASWHTGNQ